MEQLTSQETEEMFIEVKNWSKFQDGLQKKSAHASWIKLHHSLLDDYKFNKLNPNLQLSLVKIWLLRARVGQPLPYDCEFISQRAEGVTSDDVSMLLEGGWLRLDKAPYREEKRREEKSREEKTRTKKFDYQSIYDDEGFSRWWEIYPKRESKADAAKAWVQTQDQRPPLDELLEKTKVYAEHVADAERKYVKLPAGWLRDHRWDDEYERKVKLATPASLAREEYLRISTCAVGYDQDLLSSYVEAVDAGKIATPGPAAWEKWCRDHA